MADDNLRGSSRIRLAADIGGTFTDIAAFDETTGSLLLGKTLSTPDHLVEGIRDGHASAVLAASIFHFGEFTIAQAKAHMAAGGIPVRS